MATRRTTTAKAKTKAASGAKAPSSKAPAKAPAKAAPKAAARAKATSSATRASHPAKATKVLTRPAAPDDEPHRHERSVSIAATQHVVRSKNDGTIIARICVQSEHVLYGARDSKMWRRVTLGDFAAFMERAGELVKNWDGGN